MKEYGMLQNDMSRRNFLGYLSTVSAGTVAGGALLGGCSRSLSQYPATHLPFEPKASTSKVTLITGTDRRQMIYDAVKPFEDLLREDTAGKQVLIKLNCNRPDVQLIKTHPDAVRGILDVIAPFTERQILVGESTSLDFPSKETFNHFGFYELEKEFKVKLVELNEWPVSYRWILNRDLYPEKIGVLNIFLDPNVYVISVTPLKTHNAVVATLTLKNVIMGAPLKNPKRGINYKTRMHGKGIPNSPNYPSSPKLLNYNIFKLAHEVYPEFGVLDGLVGAEGDGPNNCDPVDHKVTLASPDCLAADRVGVELMGVPWEKVGYLRWCNDAGLGQGNLDKIIIQGASLNDHIITYRLHRTVKRQMEWDIPIDWNFIHPRD